MPNTIEQPFPNVFVIRHPVVQEQLTVARDANTGVEKFRRLTGQIARLMAFELTRDYPTEPVDVQTPLAPCRGCKLARGLTLVPILRAGLGMVEGILELLPSARVGHLGIYRDHDTLQPITYYNKLPPTIAQTDVIVIDPMLATAGSLIAAIEVVKKTGVERIKVLCLVAAPEGIRALMGKHPTVQVYTAAIDERLNEKGYIVPGLGDAGDRLFGTA
ncbi:MAG: uracil phosphoribosyltransferase [Phycisphaerae bacterium]|nr:MAG: uracil phosphoribosyltransferase [Planctomycetia bacterium]RIK68169.1 MAG: uracil phosphoribosyltransferase [Planctomycetota bacterium]GJQ27579.1 MAG: uracil phosphoribosyltransferase [Phycisphaerae bacterium]